MGKSRSEMEVLSGPWPVRVAWALLPVTVGPALGDALAEHSLAVARTGGIVAWLVWVGGLLAVAVPRSVSLTALRLAAPTALAIAAWATLRHDRGALDVVAVAWTLVLVLVALAPTTGDAFVNGSAYGDERRMLLRAPTPLLLGPIPLVWLATVAGPVLAPVLLAARAWALGAVVLVVGAGGSLAGARVLHGLSRRWVVFVPAGLVLHDLLAMVDAVFFPRPSITRLGPATDATLVDGDGLLDLTLGAVGVVLQLDLSEPRDVVPRRGRTGPDAVDVSHLRFMPSLPGALLEEAARRRVAVG
jgi:hypothetical protein